MATTFEKLAARIKADLKIHVVDLHRTYPSSTMKKHGAMIWRGYVEGSLIEVGSRQTATSPVAREQPLDFQRSSTYSLWGLEII